MRPPPQHPIAIAHRAGNGLDALRLAQAAGVDLIEADVWLHRGRLEVRHLKTMGPVPLLWDRWTLVRGWIERLRLAALFEAAEAAAELMLDLKGSDRRLSAAVIEAMERFIPGRPVTVCSRNWALLDAFAGRPEVRVVHSVGSAGQLRALSRLGLGRDELAISIHERLLTPATVRDLTRRAGLIMTWPINTPARMTELIAQGVNGIISDDLALLARLVRERAVSGAS